MALALLFEDTTVLYLDAVVDWNKTLSSNIANNPLDNSTVVADHVSKNNKSFTIQGVVSSADFQQTSTRSLDLLTEYSTQIPSVFNSSVNEASIGEESSLSRFFSGSLVSSLFNQQTPDVSMDSFRGYSHEVARDRLNSAYENLELITILDYNYDTFSGRTVSVRSYPNCLIENFTDHEDVQTGDCLDFTLTLKQVRFDYLKKVKVSSTTNKTAVKTKKGKVSNNTGSNKTTSSEKASDTWNRKGGYYEQTTDYFSFFKG